MALISLIMFLVCFILLLVEILKNGETRPQDSEGKSDTGTGTK